MTEQEQMVAELARLNAQVWFEPTHDERNQRRRTRLSALHVEEYHALAAKRRKLGWVLEVEEAARLLVAQVAEVAEVVEVAEVAEPVALESEAE